MARLSFMPQDTFDYCAVTIAKINQQSDEYTIESLSRDLIKKYIKSYQDKNLDKDIAEAAQRITDFVYRNSPDIDPGTFWVTLDQWQYCIAYYRLDGRKRKRKIFKGTLFHREKKEIENKAEKCLINIFLYDSLVTNGIIPLAPKGWRL